MPMRAYNPRLSGAMAVASVLTLLGTPCHAQSDCRSLALASDALGDRMQPVQSRIDAAAADEGAARSAAQTRAVCGDLRTLMPMVNRQRAMNESACFQRADMAANVQQARKTMAGQEIKAALLNERLRCGLPLEGARVLLRRYEQMGLVD